jgi:hypothetical protein
MRAESYSLNVVGHADNTNDLGAGVGRAQPTYDLTNMVVEVAGDWTGDLKVEVMVATIWLSAGTLSAQGLVQIAYPCKQVRVNTSALSNNGAALPVASLRAFNAHTYG